MKKVLTVLSVILVGTVPMLNELNIGVDTIINTLMKSFKYYPLGLLTVGIYLLGLSVKLALTNNNK